MQKELLEYQRVDGELRRMKRNLEQNEFRVQGKKYNTMRVEAEQQLSKLDGKSNELKTLAANLEKEYSKLSHILADYLDQIEGIADEDEVKYMKRKINAQLEQISICERDCRNILGEADATSKQYEEVSSRIPKLIASYNKCTSEFNKLMAEAEPKIKELQSRQNELEKLIDEGHLTLYKDIRKHDIYPVFVEFNNSSCGGCRMEISGGAVARLNEVGEIKCEHCGRIIYKN